MTNRQIKSLARKNCKINYQGIYNYLKYIQCYSRREIKVELIEYAEWIRYEYYNKLNAKEKIKDEIERKFIEYCIEYWETMEEVLEFRELLKIYQEHETRRT